MGFGLTLYFKVKVNVSQVITVERLCVVRPWTTGLFFPKHCRFYNCKIQETQRCKSSGARDSREQVALVARGLDQHKLN